MSTALHLATPGLLGPLSRTMGSPPADFAPQVINRMLERGRCEAFPGSGGNRLLCRLFGLGEPERELPVAAATRLAAGLSDQGRCWLRADPVHLLPNQEQFLLLDAPHLGLSLPEARELVADLNRHFAADDWIFEVETPERWYLGLPESVDLLSHPLEDVVGRNVHPFLPSGPGQRHWRGRLNEIQMLLHGTNLNARREADGLPVVNSLWLWGGGILPPPPATPPFTRVCADHALVQGLARWSGCELNDLGPGADESLKQMGKGESLLVLDPLQRPLLDGDLSAWLQVLSVLESSWLQPLWQALGRGHLQRLLLYPGRGKRWVITPGDRYRFWRRGPGWLPGLGAVEAEEDSREHSS